MRNANCAVLLFVIAGSAVAQTPTKKFLSKPLIIEDQGSFFVGGVPKVTNYAAGPGQPNQPAVPNQIMIGQMYVQFQIPQNKKRNTPPVIMVHGSSHTAACLESTPDGREGWSPYFVRNGVSTYIVDQAGRGRSGFDESVLHEAEAMITSGNVKGGTDLIPAFGRITDNGAWTQWFGHLTPPGSNVLTGTLIRHGDPGDPNTDDATHTDEYRPAFPRARARLRRHRPVRIVSMRWNITNSWCRTRKSRCQVPSARPAIPGNFLPRALGLRTLSRHWWRSSAEPS
jgi:hypothetical protein